MIDTTPFDVLSASTDIARNYLLEASAGTGKTFSIENIIIRLILEQNIDLPDILVVTFTKMATRDLKMRIHSKLSDTIHALKKDTPLADYLTPFLHNKDDALRRLQRNLLLFERANIETIHSFCSRTLREHALTSHTSLDLSAEEKTVSQAQLLSLIHDFLRMHHADLAKSSDAENILKAISTGNAVNPDDDDPMTHLLSNCKSFIDNYLKEKEQLRFDDIIRSMHTFATDNPTIKLRYKAVIIDEFQDTDMLQWDIFRTLFLNDDTLLYLVGDPKQSIYRFRNADIYTYLTAKASLGSDHTASLSTNFRSQKPLIDALNHLFSPSGLIELPMHDLAIDIPPMRAGTREEAIDFHDDKGSIHIYSAPYSSDSFYAYIAHEITHLKQHLPLNAIAVLLQRRTDCAQLAEVLSAHGIPAVLQKPKRLSQSTAFHTMRDCLLATAYPKNRHYVKTALGGALIGWSDAHIRKLDEENTSHSLLEATLTHFFDLATTFREQGFGAYLQRLLMIQWPLASHPLAEELLARDKGLDTYEDLMRLAEYILTKSEGKLLSIEETVALFHLMQMDEDENDRSIKRTHTESDAVQLMTLHGSKGLEFQVVFAHGLIAKSPKLPAFFPDGSPPRLVHKKDSKDKRLLRYVRELDAEKMRQLYVAMTRAKQRLYLPLSDYSHFKRRTLGDRAPLEIYLEKLGMPFLDFIRPFQHLITHTAIADVALTINQTKHTPPVALVPPQFVNKSVRRHVHSFSSLTANKISGNLPDLEVPHDLTAVNKTPHTLPAGSQTGIILHRLLEKVPHRRYGTVSEVKEAILPYIYETEYLPWAGVLAEIIFNCLTVPLLTNFCLHQIKPEETFREIEFLYPARDVQPNVQPHSLIKGVIDFAFAFEGKYYLLDWKSNWLGPDTSHYNREQLKHHLTLNCYDLQAALYTEAYRRYLALMDKRPFDEIFGGVFYLFLRGLAPHQESGIIHFFPQEMRGQ